jgi:hypothetical protein
MLYFHYFMVGSWMFAIGWFLGAVCVQNHNEKTQRLRMNQKPERCPECESWRLPVVASASAD